MPRRRSSTLSLTVEAANDEELEWSWVIHREPESLLILRSRPMYSDQTAALLAGRIVVHDISRRLGLPIIGGNG